jgi:D-glycero-D-manno-heptose 1,7-bisphosphate phosphatase
MAELRPAVFLDRDGVINDGSLYYTYRPADFLLNPGAGEGLSILSRAGFQLVVVTNQGGIAKGVYGHADVQLTHRYMAELLAGYGVELAGVYYCPHHSDVSGCLCRKPKPGMLLQAISDLSIDAAASYLIGDSPRDIEAAQSAGVQGFLIEKNSNIIQLCRHISSKRSIHAQLNHKS